MSKIFLTWSLFCLIPRYVRPDLQHCLHLHAVTLINILEKLSLEHDRPRQMFRDHLPQNALGKNLLLLRNTVH